jgi:hypothetical protein
MTTSVPSGTSVLANTVSTIGAAFEVVHSGGGLSGAVSSCADGPCTKAYEQPVEEARRDEARRTDSTA